MDLMIKYRQKIITVSYNLTGKVKLEEILVRKED